VVPRADLTIATKAGITRTPESRTVDASRGALLRRLDESLVKLGTDYVDLWYVHYVDDSVPFEETLGALDHAVATGKARYVGVSNYCGWRLGRAAAWQQAVPGRAPIVANQVRYSLLDRGIEREVVPAADALGVGIMPYSPLGGGLLTGKYRDGVPADSRAAASRVLPLDQGAAAAGIVEAVATAAEGLATSPVSVALAWLRDRPGVTAPILGARTLGQLTAALASETLELPAEIVSALDDVSAPPVDYPEDVR
jgi:aryl-alcohol dehydrogenase-like predicted oxidoreductase